MAAAGESSDTASVEWVPKKKDGKKKIPIADSGGASVGRNNAGVCLFCDEGVEVHIGHIGPVNKDSSPNIAIVGDFDEGI